MQGKLYRGIYMADIKEMIKNYMEEKMYQSNSEYTYNFRVEQVDDYTYGVYIINSFADIEYSFSDVQEDEDGYSAIIDFVYCKINGFTVTSETDYYVDKLDKYMKSCEIVYEMLNSVDTYFDDRRTYFG